MQINDDVFDQIVKNKGWLQRNKTTKLPKYLISKIKETIKNEKIPCLLYTTGSFCPIHFGHINLF